MHLTTEIALDFLEGRFDTDEEAFWKQHMDDCSKCAKDVLRWRQIMAIFEGTPLSSASPEELEKAFDVFSRADEADRSGIPLVSAAIIFDSFTDAQPAGVRGPAAGNRQIVMRAEEFDIHIKIWNAGERRQLLGQLLPRDGRHFGQPARFHLLWNGERCGSTLTDEAGEFQFRNVPEGDLSLQVDLPNLTVIGALNLPEKR